MHNEVSEDSTLDLFNEDDNAHASEDLTQDEISHGHRDTADSRITNGAPDLTALAADAMAQGGEYSEESRLAIPSITARLVSEPWDPSMPDTDEPWSGGQTSSHGDLTPIHSQSPKLDVFSGHGIGTITLPSISDQLGGLNHLPEPSDFVDSEDDVEDEPKNQSESSDADEVRIIPTLEGFEAHIRRLNPDVDPRLNWLITRISHHQENRYKRLLDLRVKHSLTIMENKCAAGSSCISLGGTAVLLDARGNPREQDPQVSALQLITDFSEDSNPGEGCITEESFPTGVPVPPVQNLPAEFECQICFKVKRCQKPSDWTKHVHEDVQPFTCTYENCKEPKSFKRKVDWVRHENERHRHLEWWTCQVDECRHPCYRKDNFLQHLVREHKLPEPKQKTKAAIRKAGLTEPAWIMLERCHHETQNKPQDEPCKFCGKAFNTWKKLTVHLAKHMEHIGLPILRLVEAENIDANTIIDPIEDTIVTAISATKTQVHAAMHEAEAPSPFHREAEQDWDLKSIASLNTFRDSALGSSIPSDMSVSVVQGLPRTAQEEILIILSSDHQLRSLFEEAARRITKPRFVRNIRRLFLLFHKDLQDKAVDPREKDASNIIERHSQWLASRLFDICDPENGSNAQVFVEHLNQQIDKRPLLEQYLASMKSSSTTPGDDTKQVRRKGKRKGSDSSSSEDGDEGWQTVNIIDYSKFPNLDHIRNFMIGGTAFEALRRNTLGFVHPEKLTIPLLVDVQRQSSAPDTKDVSVSVMESQSGSQDPQNTVSIDSTSSAATTEVTNPDMESDLEDDFSDLSSDPDLYNGVPEDRISNPKEYFDRLRSLERNISVNSRLKAYKTGISAGNHDDTCFLRASGFNRYDEIMPHIISTESQKLLQLLECYNIVVWVDRSLTYLCDARYCTSHVGLLIQDQARPEVAKLVQVEITAILDLCAVFEGLMNAVMWTLSSQRPINADTINLEIVNQDNRRGVTAKCLEMLTVLGLSSYLMLTDVQPVLWECALQTLEIGILSYAGAHIQRFDRDLFEIEVDSFQIPQKFTYHNEHLRRISSRPTHQVINIQRRRLQCLDKFLGEIRPWVFHQDVARADIGNQRLCLSTTIDGLTDLWGPSWKIIRNSDPEVIQQIDIGNGAIIPWLAIPNEAENALKIEANEIFCHWISFHDWSVADVEVHQSCLHRKHFLNSDILLIGASNDYGLVLNPECTSSIERLFSMKTKFDQQGALRAPNTFRAHRYIDSHAVQVQGTAMGILSAAGIVTYKRRSGQTMKDALVERWRHNLRNPMDLEAFSGVEISICTRNARRRRLLHLLGSPTMSNYLRIFSFPWISESCEYAYFKALRSPKLFRKFWKGHPEYQENVGDAIFMCLDALVETGIDENSRELRCLWVESFDTEGDSDGESDEESDNGERAESSPQSTAITKPSSSFFEEWIVTLFKSEHTWTGFLEDSEESLTMAVLGMSCLDFDHGGYGRRCSQRQSSCKGYPVLQTSLQINESILKGEKLKQEKVDSGRTVIWNARELKKGTSFCLGDHGTLKVLSASSRICPAIMEWSGVKSEMLQEVKNVAINEKMLGKNAERHHREYIRGKWEAKPMPVLILSKSTKVTFSKH